MATQLKSEAPRAEVKEKLQEINYLLADEDLNYSPGNEAGLPEHLSKKPGRSTVEVKDRIESVSFNSGKASWKTIMRNPY